MVPVSHKKETTSTSKASDSDFPPEKRRKEQQKFGVFFDDDYDYLQHLRVPGKPDVFWEEVPHKHADDSSKTKIQLPSSVFASEFEEAEGMLNKAAPRSGPRLDWDPDIVEALDEDFDFDDPDNQLDDDFIEKAMEGTDGEDADDEEEEWGDESDVDSNEAGYSDEADDEVAPLPGGRKFASFGDDDEETKSRFTEYSMTSSVIRRNQQLSLLDDRFEKFYENYDDPEVGALDCEEIEGHVDINDEVLMRIANDFSKNEKPQQYDKAWDVCRLVKLKHDEDKEEEIVELEVSDYEDGDRKQKKKWDCESILSTYSNIYNHPKVIDVPSKKNKIQINRKTGLPMNVLDGEKGKLTERALAKLALDEEKAAGPKSLCAESVLSTLSVLSIRPKDETPEERRERKKLLKEYRNERRFEKKSNKIAFKEEQLRQNVLQMNAKNNLQGNKIV